MPTIDIPDKICSHCGGTRWYTKIDKHINKQNILKEYTSYTCLKKLQEGQVKYNLKNPEVRKGIEKRNREKNKSNEDYCNRAKKRAAEYYKKNIEKCKALVKKKRLENPAKHSALCTKNKKKYRDTLHDHYIKRLFKERVGCKEYTLTSDEIHIYRKLLLTKRQLQNEKEN